MYWYVTCRIHVLGFVFTSMLGVYQRLLGWSLFMYPFLFSLICSLSYVTNADNSALKYLGAWRVALRVDRVVIAAATLLPLPQRTGSTSHKYVLQPRNTNSLNIKNTPKFIMSCHDVCFVLYKNGGTLSLQYVLPAFGRHSLCGTCLTTTDKCIFDSFVQTSNNPDLTAF